MHRHIKRVNKLTIKIQHKLYMCRCAFKLNKHMFKFTTKYFLY